MKSLLWMAGLLSVIPPPGGVYSPVAEQETGTSSARVALKNPRSEAASREFVEARGRISGTVMDSDAAEPIAGAYVQIDHSGDAGEPNLERFRKQGRYVTAITDIRGRFVLDGVALDQKHPFYVTRTGYVRHEQTIAVPKERPGINVQVDLKPAACIVATVDSGEEPASKETLWLRLEAKDGRLFVPMREDWPRYPYRLERAKKGGRAVFDELDAGVFAVEAMRISPSETVYCGRVSDVEVRAGETRTVRIEGPVSRTRAAITIAADPRGGERAGEPSHRGQEQSRKAVIVVVSQKPGLLLWSTGKHYHPEDPRLGRIMSMGLLHLPVTAGPRYTLVNLPTGTYSVLAITIGNYTGQTRGPTGAYVRGARLEICKGQAANIEIPWTEPIGPSGGPYHALNKPVSLGPGQQSMRDLCRALTATTRPHLQVSADPAIQDETVALQFEQAPIWEVLETLYLEKGWIVIEEGRETIVLGPEP